MNFPLILFFFFYFCMVCCLQGLSKVVEKVEFKNEASVLLSLKDKLIDPLDQLKDWKLHEKEVNSSAHCSWTGVKCNLYGAVEKLDLSHMNLSGIVAEEFQQLKSLSDLNLCCNGFSSILPKSFSNFAALNSIDLSQNFFVGSFSAGFGFSARMTILNASSNNFSGYLPEDIGNATMLETLDLRMNFFEGSIPKSYKNLVKLKFLGLSGNNLTGRIPGEIGELSALETLVLGYNEFEGNIPNEIGNLSNLKYLDLAIGNLGGRVPASIGKLQKLDTLFLYQNSLEGPIPSSIGNLTSVQLLDLSDNMLSGIIPSEIGNLKNLQLLNVMGNNLSGSIPDGIAGLTQLSVLELWSNSLSGPLPGDLGRNSPLQWLDISSNSFSGPIPESLCEKGNLTKLILFNNGFTGPIPDGLSTCMSLVRVRMQNNLLSGTIPVGFGKLGKLQRLELANNHLTGQIPSDLASSVSLSFIDVSKNRLQSSLPSSILSIPNLQSFLATENNLLGEIPDLFQDCPSLAMLDLSSNHITGNIPKSIASCQKLVNLKLRSNQLSGNIPTGIAMMPTLSVLDISDNTLTGGIPENFGNSPALETLNVSFNRLEGPVSENGMLRTINPNDLIGNTGLCGSVLPPCSQNAAYTTKQKSLHKHIIAGWVIGISTLLTLVIALFGARFVYYRWYAHGSCFKERYEPGKGEWPWRLMAFQRLRFTSSDILACVNESNKIGMGATGTVYKAEMQWLNTAVAVKKLWRSGTEIEMGASEDLVGEVNVLGKLRHRNIVKLLGFLHNNIDAMILYEYMENGSLGEALHGKQAGKLLVDWVSRYNIAIGVAHGLVYLHHDCHPPVIHRDIKPNNILLDSNLKARIADFGLAKMMLKKNETVSMVAGSYGYIAPEYGYTLKVDEKSDIYSYGVVLMELVTGKQALEPEFRESVDINEWVRRKIRDGKPLEEALDNNVGITKHVQEEMILVLRIAILCTAKNPKDRPSMRDVLTMLVEAKPRRKSTSISGGAAANKDKLVFSASPVIGLV
ncbi:hypothetical protein LIER_26548 [Lithospermum erythrorhizon]|uniref:Protein kinase domain-containing protein n=1 Tax=Lithospermum erythrorhizon TaxID=34254 RepID=A0AAV3RAU1_LITER